MPAPKFTPDQITRTETVTTADGTSYKRHFVKLTAEQKAYFAQARAEVEAEFGAEYPPKYPKKSKPSVTPVEEAPKTTPRNGRRAAVQSVLGSAEALPSPALTQKAKSQKPAKKVARPRLEVVLVASDSALMSAVDQYATEHQLPNRGAVVRVALARLVGLELEIPHHGWQPGRSRKAPAKKPRAKAARKS